MNTLFLLLAACQTPDSTSQDEVAPERISHGVLALSTAEGATVLELADVEISLDSGATGLFESGPCRGAASCISPIQRRTERGWEWWQDSEQGLEQGWVIEEGGDALSQRVSVQGATPEVLSTTEVSLRDADGTTQLRMHGLAAWDAEGKALHAGFRVQGQEVWIDADTRDAVWPVTLDPFYSKPVDEIVGGYGLVFDYGASVRSAGDLDGDGYDELLVVAPELGSRGALWVYMGSALGPSLEPDVALEGEMFQDVGVAYAADGDLNGDGYDDLVLRRDRDAVFLEVFLGSASGITSEPDAEVDAERSDLAPYDTVFCDVDGDGLDDVVAHAASLGFYVYAGQSSGLSTSPQLTSVSHIWELDCAGDIDGDGDEEILVGSASADDWNGQAALYLGDPSGLSDAPAWTQSGSSSAPYFGASVAGVGDVDGDGFDDVAVGYLETGLVEVFLGSSVGMATTPAQSYAALVGTHELQVAAAGDVDGDGMDDLALLEPEFGNTGTSNLGRITLHLGASGGPSITPDAKYFGDPEIGLGTVAAAGDLDGDGADELALGMSGRLAGALTLRRGNLKLDHSWEPEDQLMGFAHAVVSGDWNADGYDDVVTSSCEYDHVGPRVLMYLGSASGVDDGIDIDLNGWDITPELYDGFACTGFESLGDLDGDGYPELLVFANYANGGVGAAYLYYGDATGLDLVPEVLSPATGMMSFAQSAASGDVNGDGYADLVVTGLDSSYRGLVSVFEGGPTGVSATATYELAIVSGPDLALGDWNDDGVDDLAILFGDMRGKTPLYIYYGSSVGLGSSHDELWSTSGVEPTQLVNAGDINGDGVDDLLALSSHKSWLYLGGSGGTSMATTSFSVKGNKAESWGVARALGDVNGDGFADVAVASERWSNLFLGSSGGLSAIQDKIIQNSEDSLWVFELDAGDFDGDGYLDLVVASPSTGGHLGRLAFHTGGLDSDGDLWLDSEDCDPADPSVTSNVYYADLDGDGYGDPESWTTGCTKPSGYVVNKKDCSDRFAHVNPDGIEVCDGGLDEDCNGLSDDQDPGVTETITLYLDADRDDYGISTDTVQGCREHRISGQDYVEVDGDCDDDDWDVNPGELEICDARRVDEDCNGLVNEMDPTVSDAKLSYMDGDGDGYGSEVLTPILACELPLGSSWVAEDCDDGDPLVNPSAVEICDPMDQDEDCNGLADDADSGPAGTMTWYIDGDLDGYGADGLVFQSCEAPNAAVSVAGDCNDSAAAIHPGAVETCDLDGVDEDCDGVANGSDAVGILSWYADTDGDGFGDPAVGIESCSAPTGYVANALDCDDTRGEVNPDAPEVCEAQDIDEDCDGLFGDADAEGAIGALTLYVDLDGDGYGNASTALSMCGLLSGLVLDFSDCDDARSDVNPGAAEICDELDLDEDCDGAADDLDAQGAQGGALYYEDQDGDGFAGTSSALRCDSADAWMSSTQDCDDTQAQVNPEAAEIADDGIDQDCDGVDSVTEPSEEGAQSCNTSVLPTSPWGVMGSLLGLVLLARRRRSSPN